MSARGKYKEKSSGEFWAVGLAVGVAAATLSGCGGDKDNGSAAPIVRAAATAAPTTPAPDPFPGQSGEQIFMLAANTMKGVDTAIVGITAVEDGVKNQMRVGMTTSGQCAGHFLVQGGNFEVIGHGKTTYMKGDRAAWTAQLGARQGGALDTLLKGRWVKLPADSGLDIQGFCDLSTYVMDLTTSTSSDATRGKPTTVNGHGAVPVTGPLDDGGTLTLYVATEGQPYILTAVRTGPDADTEVLSDFNKPITANPPPPSLTVDISALHQPDGDGFSI